MPFLLVARVLHGLRRRISLLLDGLDALEFSRNYTKLAMLEYICWNWFHLTTSNVFSFEERRKQFSILPTLCIMGKRN